MAQLSLCPVNGRTLKAQIALETPHLSESFTQISFMVKSECIQPTDITKVCGDAYHVLQSSVCLLLLKFIK